MIAQLGGEHLIEFALEPGAGAEEDALRRLPSVVSLRPEEEGYCLAVAAPDIAIPALLSYLQGQHLNLARLTTRHASLEDVFVALSRAQAANDK